MSDEPAPIGPARWLWRRFENIVAILGLGACAATITAFGGAGWWAFDLSSHFRVQYFGGLLMASTLMWVAKRRWLATLFTVMCLVNLATIVPQYLPRAGAPETATAGAPLRLMQINVRTDNTRHDLVAAAIRRHDPDVLVLQEVDQAWIDALAEVLAGYPHRLVEPRNDNFGIAVFSRPAFEGVVRPIGPTSLPSIRGRLVIDGAPVTLIATHPVPPNGADGSRRRDEQLAALAEVVRGAKPPVVVIGDLNVTPWSAPFRALLRETGLRDASRGRGVHATWRPARLPFMAIPIDHCLHSAGIAIAGESVGGNVGSDHRPLIVDLLVAAPVD